MTPEVLNYRKWQQGTHFHCETCGEVFLTIERGWLPDEHDGTFDYRVMALAEIRQGCSSKFPTLGGCHCSGRRVPVAA